MKTSRLVQEALFTTVQVLSARAKVGDDSWRRRRSRVFPDIVEEDASLVAELKEAVYQFE